MTDLNNLPPGRKRALLAERLRRRSTAAKAYPLSFGQQRLWFLDKFVPGLPLYSIPIALMLRGELDVAALRSSLDTIVARHASLRTTFPDQGGEPVQLVAPSGSAAFEVHTLDVPAGDSTDAAAARFADQQARVGFDLATGPLFRASLGVLSPTEHVLVLNQHHIISDAWSLSVLCTELTELYRADVEDRQAELAELTLQFPDFTTWQRERQTSGAIRHQLDYWRGHLAGAPELLTLPTDRPRPAVQSYRGALHSVHLDDTVAAGVEETAKRCGGTPFTVLLAAFAAQLGRLAGQDDVVISTPVAGRTDAAVEKLIGFFVNTLPLRLSIAGDPTFAELVWRARQVTLDGLSNAEIPFERLVEMLQPQRSLGHAPLSQAQLILPNVPHTALTLPGITSSTLIPDPGVSKVDITLVVETIEGHPLLSIEYNTDLFDSGTIARFAEHLVDLLTAAGRQPDRRLSELTAVSGPQRWQVLVGFNSTDAELPAATTVLDLIPFGSTEIAVSGHGTELSYAELDRRANRMAQLLRANGVVAGTTVGLHLDRTPELLVALLAVWRAGGAYVPLDPTWPPDRLTLMLADSDATVLITDRTDGPVATFTGVVVRPDDPAGAQMPHTPPEATTSQDHLAYLIYTSGSTGRPKGVGVPHRALVNLLSSFLDTLAVEPGDRLAAVTTLSFDISVLELLLPLVAGARVVIVDAATAVDGPALRRTLVDSGATIMQATPVTWRILGAAGGVPESVQVRICGGEAFPADLTAELTATDAVVWNAYGPTETTVWSAAGPVTPEDTGAVPIGPPIGNNRLYVLDPRGEPVPIGVVGELHIGGAGVARGYHKRPALTAEKFVPDPFGGTPGARLYATGDLARYRPDGMLEFLGRTDHQVKVRGFRIEPGEIEAALLADDRVREAVVVTHGDGQDARLVAYLTGTTVDATELERTLRQSLPEYMVPAAITWLDALPLTPNGKVDRRALPEPDFAGRVDWVGPRDAVEEVLAEIWRAELGGTQVGVRDDFFRLGGHSLLAAKVLAKVREAFEIDVPLHRMFAAPTVEGLADALAELESEPGQVKAVAAVRLEVAALSDGQVRSLLGD